MEDKSLLLKRIANQQLMFGSFSTNLGVVHGKMGLAIFFFHYARYTNNSLFEDFAGEVLEEVFEDMHSEMSWGFENGLCGIGWAIKYLLVNHFIGGNSNDILFEIDQKIMEKDLRRMTDYSFKNGLEGLAWYVLLRLTHQGDQPPFDFIFIDEFRSICLKAKLNQNYPSIISKLIEDYDQDSSIYFYNYVFDKIIFSQNHGQLDELSWKNGLKLLLL